MCGRIASCSSTMRKRKPGKRASRALIASPKVAGAASSIASAPPVYERSRLGMRTIIGRRKKPRRAPFGESVSQPAPRVQSCALDRVNMGKVARDTLPTPALIATPPNLAAGGPEVNAHCRCLVHRHCLTLDRPPCLGLRQTGRLPLPGLATVHGAVRSRFSARRDARPFAAPHGTGADRAGPAG